MKSYGRIALGIAALAAVLAAEVSVHAAPAKKSEISIEKAARIALERVPGGVVEEIERDIELGKVVYEVDVRGPDGREHDIVIDASNGKVLSDRIDDDDD